MALLVLLLVEGGARVVAPELQPVHRWPGTDYVAHDLQLAEAADDVDLLVVGSSSAGVAIRPDDLSADSAAGVGYNYWLAGAPMRSVELLTTEVLLDRTTPSTVIIGVTMRELTSTDALDAHYAALEAAPAFQEAAGRRSWLDPADDWLQRHSTLARHRAAFRDPVQLMHELRAPKLGPDPLAADGHLEGRGDNRLADEPAEHVAQERAAMADFTVAPQELAALSDLLDELDRQGIRALVVNLPVSKHFISMADGGWDAYDRYLAEVEARALAHGGDWLDAMKEPWPDGYFGDVNHLNDRGQERLQPMLVAALET